MSKFPEVGGTIGMFRDAILSVSKSEQKDMALGCALAIGGALTANRFSLNGMPMYTPMYVMNLGSTSSGKDSGIKFISDLFGPKGLGRNKHFNLLGLTNYSSDVSMISTLPEQRTRLDYFEEFGEVLKGLAMKGDRKASIGDCLKKLFSARAYIKGHYTVTKGWMGECAFPCVNVFATTQPDTMILHSSPEIIFDGLLGRFIPFYENKGAPYLGNQRLGGINGRVLETITQECLRIYPENPLEERDMLGNLVVNQKLADFKRQEITLPAALNEAIGEADHAHHNAIEGMKKDGLKAEAAAYGRVMENTEKIMKILCVGYGERTISREHFDEAHSIVMASYEANRILIAGAWQGKIRRDADKLLAVVERSKDRQIKRTLAMQLSHLDGKEMRDAVDYLEQSGKVYTFSPPGEKQPNGRAIAYLCAAEIQNSK